MECGSPAAAFAMEKVHERSMSGKRPKLEGEALPVIALLAAAALLAFSVSPQAAMAPKSSQISYLGFDRNTYPGDAALPILRKTFSFSSYWLSPPPGEKTNTWRGKRKLFLAQGFGFLVLYRGRDSKEFKKQAGAIAKGVQDGKSAAANAKAEGFATGTIIFLDIEEGGRLPSAYHAYLHAWHDELTKASFSSGVYCSGMPVKESPGLTITTADDIRDNSALHDFAIWAYNDACPPSHGCTFPENPPPPSSSGIGNATVWQFAQSPRRKEFTAHCSANYHKDANCYAPGDTAFKWFLDVNSATSPDPSGGAK
jgi:Domain of unknown function (DUF1906)